MTHVPMPSAIRFYSRWRYVGEQATLFSVVSPERRHLTGIYE